MRGIKAEGGWGVVNSEFCSIHPTSDHTCHPNASLWDEGDVKNMAAMAEAVHAHGALAGVELWHGGGRSGNLVSREVALSPESILAEWVPWQSQRMDRQDIANYRDWHRAAALRAGVTPRSVCCVCTMRWARWRGSGTGTADTLKVGCKPADAPAGGLALTDGVRFVQVQALVVPVAVGRVGVVVLLVLAVLERKANATSIFVDLRSGLTI